jgi:hypothetical protein
MPDARDLIFYEPEHTAFDSKLEPYTKDQHDAFLKDVIAMANADVDGDRHIAIGLKVFPTGHREYRGLKPEELKDSAIYNQLVRENIEPDLSLSYVPHEVEGKTYGLFRIFGCTEQPYVMRKQFKDLERGEGWIRRGTSQSRLTRADLDRIYKRRAEAEGFTDEVRVTWDAPGEPTELELASAGEVFLPSDKARVEILQILKRRKLMGKTASEMMGASFLGPRSYDSMSSEELRKELERLGRGYSDTDKWILYEKLAHKVNILLYNAGTTHLQDVMIEVRIPNIEGIGVADRVYSRPIYNSYGIRQFYDVPWPGYPSVSENESVVVVRSKPGDLRHHVPTPAFQVPLRIAALKQAESERLAVTCALHAKNLRKPRAYTLTLAVTPGTSIGYQTEDEDDPD